MALLVSHPKKIFSEQSEIRRSAVSMCVTPSVTKMRSNRNVFRVSSVCCAFQLAFYLSVGSSRVPWGPRRRHPPLSARRPSTLSRFEGRHLCTIALVPTPWTEFLHTYHPYDTFFVSPNELSVPKPVRSGIFTYSVIPLA